MLLFFPWIYCIGKKLYLFCKQFKINYFEVLLTDFVVQKNGPLDFEFREIFEIYAVYIENEKSRSSGMI